MHWIAIAMIQRPIFESVFAPVETKLSLCRKKKPIKHKAKHSQIKNDGRSVNKARSAVRNVIVPHKIKMLRGARPESDCLSAFISIREPSFFILSNV